MIYRYVLYAHADTRKHVSYLQSRMISLPDGKLALKLLLLRDLVVFTQISTAQELTYVSISPSIAHA